MTIYILLGHDVGGNGGTGIEGVYADLEMAKVAGAQQSQRFIGWDEQNEWHRWQMLCTPGWQYGDGEFWIEQHEVSDKETSC